MMLPSLSNIFALTTLFLVITSLPRPVQSSKYASQLYEDLLYWYQKNVRPVKNYTDILNVKFGSSLIRIIELDEVNQVLTTNLWLEMQWTDYNLVWDPNDYGGIIKLHVPSDQLWLPDIVLYNNAHGNPQITIMADALVFYDGTVIWRPPAIYNSFCSIDIEFFPYDKQICDLKFGAWTYTGDFIDLSLIVNDKDEQVLTKCPDKLNTPTYDIYTCKHYTKTGMDLSNFQQSAEWDLLALEARHHEVIYLGCCGSDPYIDVTFVVTIRRKPLFYTVNLVIPCMLIAILTTFVFYIPPMGHKITFAVSVLVTLIFFFLILIDLIPPTSLVIPLIGKYLLFTIMLVFVPELCAYGGGALHSEIEGLQVGHVDETSLSSSRRLSASSYLVYANTQMRLTQLAELRGMHPDVIRRMVDNVSFIAEHFRAVQAEDQISEDWSYVAMVIDRLFLILFTIVNLIGTFVIIMQAPYWFDSTAPMRKPPPVKPLGGDTGIEAMITANWSGGQ